MKYISILLFSFTTFSLSAQEITDAYNFSIKPGSEAWGKLKTHEDMIRVCQIPEDKLTTLTTKALLETCLSYPLMPDIFAHNNMKEGFDRTFGRFNGYGVLISRQDFASELIKMYKKLNLTLLDTMQSDAEKGFFVIKTSVTELFFGTADFITQLPTVDSKEALSILIGKLNDKAPYSNVFG